MFPFAPPVNVEPNLLNGIVILLGSAESFALFNLTTALPVVAETGSTAMVVDTAETKLPWL